MAEISPNEPSVAVITGGGGGMGVACAHRLGRSHAVVLAEIDADRLNAASAALRSDGRAVTPMLGDITKPDFVATLVDKTRSIGRLGVLVHTAGLSPSMAGYQRVLEVNLLGTALVERAFLPLAGPGSAAILIASTAGHMSPFGDRLDALFDKPLAPDFLAHASAEISTGEGAYFASKRGVIRYCEQVAPEWAKRGGRIVTISPGMIDTPMNALEFKKQPLMKTMLDLTPIPRFGAADEIAAAVEFLASKDAAFITATDIRIDGGSTPLFREIAARRGNA